MRLKRVEQIYVRRHPPCCSTLADRLARRPYSQYCQAGYLSCSNCCSRRSPQARMRRTNPCQASLQELPRVRSFVLS